jgi:hypothetical protein
MVAARGLNKLCGEANATSYPPDTSLEDIPNPEFLLEVFDFWRFTFVME